MSVDVATSSTFNRRHRVFYLVVLVTLVLFGFVGVVLLQPDLIAGLLGHDIARHVGHHFRSPHHRIHDLTFSFLMGTVVVGLFAQLRMPWKNIAAQFMALIPWIGLALASALTNAPLSFAPAPILGSLTLIACILHPNARDLVTSFTLSRVNRVTLALIIIGAVPLLAFASTNIGLQRTLTDDHAALGHYGFLAAFSFTVIGVGLLASLRPEGRWLPAWVAGLLPALLGLASMIFPDVDSSLSVVWALAAIVWGFTFVAAGRTRL